MLRIFGIGLYASPLNRSPCNGALDIVVTLLLFLAVCGPEWMRCTCTSILCTLYRNFRPL